ncbi:MAG TPA: hypothetical protein VHA12_02870 [Candidatus Nanoarchaeia archaeon]|nr:hypothetical protein [Candidatus Nanoarchaeia archaeon]
MGGQKTRDGLRLRDILRASTEAGAGYREGTNHPLLLTYQGMRPCPIATSTDARRMVTPWLAQATGRSAYETYESLRRGSW